jgi:hypothetical protein
LVLSLPCFNCFSPVFLPLQKSTLLNSNLDSVDSEPLCGNATVKGYLSIYLDKWIIKRSKNFAERKVVCFLRVQHSPSVALLRLSYEYNGAVVVL